MRRLWNFKLVSFPRIFPVEHGKLSFIFEKHEKKSFFLFCVFTGVEIKGMRKKGLTNAKTNYNHENGKKNEAFFPSRSLISH